MKEKVLVVVEYFFSEDQGRYIIEIKKVADKWGLPIVEDAAEALGSWLFNDGDYTHCGLNGEIGVFSFNGNKIITTGGGGMLITNNQKLAETCSMRACSRLCRSLILLARKYAFCSILQTLQSETNCRFLHLRYPNFCTTPNSEIQQKINKLSLNPRCLLGGSNLYTGLFCFLQTLHSYPGVS